MSIPHTAITYPAVLAISLIIIFAFLIFLVTLYIMFYTAKIAYYSIRCHGYAIREAAISAGRKLPFDYFELRSIQRVPYDHKKDDKVIFHRICRN